jgi:hypothetical protein
MIRRHCKEQKVNDITRLTAEARWTTQARHDGFSARVSRPARVSAMSLLVFKDLTHDQPLEHPTTH